MNQNASPIAAALRRLDEAVDALEAAANRRLAAEKADADRLAELDLMRVDRSRLADLLDEALARNDLHDRMRAELDGRVERAIALVTDALGDAE